MAMHPSETAAAVRRLPFDCLVPVGLRILCHRWSHGHLLPLPQYRQCPRPMVPDSAEAFISCTVLTQDLGADEVLDYRTERFEQKYRDARFDVVLDVIGGEVGSRQPAGHASKTCKHTPRYVPFSSQWPCMCLLCRGWAPQSALQTGQAAFRRLLAILTCSH